MSGFLATVTKSPALITDGGIETRILYETDIKLPPEIEVAGLIDDPAGKSALYNIYKSYLDVGKKFDLPILIGTPTFRANLARIQKAGFEPNELFRINQGWVKLQEDLRKEYGEYAKKIFIGGVIGPKNDAYKPQEALSSQEAYIYHLDQVNIFANSDVDFLFAPTFPAITEALGVAQAMATSKLPYVISFIIDAAGKLLDGTLLANAIAMMDDQINPPPAFYSLSCIHPTICDQAMQNPANQKLVGNRLLEIKANASAKSPEELVQLKQLATEDAQKYAEEMLQLKEKYGFKILGGCCGTNAQHIYQIAKLLTRKKLNS